MAARTRLQNHSVSGTELVQQFRFSGSARVEAPMPQFLAVRAGGDDEVTLPVQIEGHETGHAAPPSRQGSSRSRRWVWTNLFAGSCAPSWWVEGEPNPQAGSGPSY